VFRSSAGGFGALANWWQTQQAFGSTRVDMIDDSGTPMPPDIDAVGNGAFPLQLAAWNVAGSLPPGCTDCGTRRDAIFAYYLTAMTGHRAALLSYTQDTTLPTFFGITIPQFTAGLNEELAMYFPATGPFKSFTVAAMGHPLWFAQPPAPSQQFQQLSQFLGAMLSDDPAWTNVP